MNSTMEDIDSLASSGKAVIAGADSDIVEIVKLAVEANCSVSFYLTRAQADAFVAWFWTPERVRATGVELISKEEGRRIHSELGLKVDDFRYAPIECQHCSHSYGAFDFFQQGTMEHGSELLQSVFSLKNAVLLQVNPTFVPICPNCDNSLRVGGEVAPMGFYFGSGYAACVI